MSRRRIKLPNVGAFNSGRGSLQSLRPQPHLNTESFGQYQLLTDWERVNFYSRKQSRRLIRTNVLLGFKYKGRWWVRINPNCNDVLANP